MLLSLKVLFVRISASCLVMEVRLNLGLLVIGPVLDILHLFNRLVPVHQVFVTLQLIVNVLQLILQATKKE